MHAVKEVSVVPQQCSERQVFPFAVAEDLLLIFPHVYQSVGSYDRYRPSHDSGYGGSGPGSLDSPAVSFLPLSLPGKWLENISA